MQNTLTKSSIVVLVVDDDPYWLQTFSQQLAALGIVNVLCAPDGAAALEVLRARTGDVDLVICDISMPEADGFHVLEDIAHTGFDGKVLFVSGMDSGVRYMLKIISDATHIEVLDILEKPVSLQQLGTAVSTALV